MPHDILADLGPVFLGSRLKRLADRLQTEAAGIIRDAGLPIQPSQFPVLAALDRYGPLTVGALGEALGVTQPAATRAALALIELDLVGAATPEADLRRKTLSLTTAGANLIAIAKARIWPPVAAAVAELCDSLPGPLLDQLAGLEHRLDAASLGARVGRIQADRNEAKSAFSVREYSDELAQDFQDINVEWIEEMFCVEENDRRILSNPRELIVDRGGVILFVQSADLGVVGACALIKIDDASYELTKMGVSARARGRKAGEFLLQAVLERARAMAIETLYLLTNTRCAAAVHLYEKFGFEHDTDIMARYGARYARCDVAMRWRDPQDVPAPIAGRPRVPPRPVEPH